MNKSYEKICKAITISAVLIVGLASLVPTSLASTTRSFILEVGLCVDGSDFLHFQGSSIWVVHQHFELPGWHPSCTSELDTVQCAQEVPCPGSVRVFDDEGKVLSEASWLPDWFTDSSRNTRFDPESAACGFTGCVGFVSSTLSVSPMTSDTANTVDVVQGRGIVRQVQSPSQSNAFTAIFLLDDVAPAEAAWYQVRIHASPALQIGLCVDGSELVHMDEDELWIVHRHFELPGWHPDCTSTASTPIDQCPNDLPCAVSVKVLDDQDGLVSSALWLPDWFTDETRSTAFDPSTRTCGFFGCTGFVSSQFVLPLRVRLLPSSMEVVMGRGTVTVQQQPSASNGFTTTLLLDDDSLGGPGWYEFRVRFRPLPRLVQVDVKPGSDPNSISLRSSGTIPAAVLSSSTLDAPEEVEISSLTFGATGNENSLGFCNPAEDVNKDGFLDLVCHFEAQRTNFTLQDTQAILKGRLLDGTSIEGRDAARIMQ